MGYWAQIPVGMLLSKMYCSKCGQRLKLKKRSDVYHFGDSEYRYFSSNLNHLKLDPEQTKIDYVYYCPNCNTTITYKKQCEIRKMQKKKGCLILSEEE